MATKKKISYESAIGSFMQKHFSNCKMNRSGKELIAEILQEIHSSLIVNFENEYQSTKDITDTAVIKCVEKAVTKTLPTGIRAHAMAEANRQLMLFQQGLLEYDHVASIKALKALPEYTGKGADRKPGAEGEKISGPPYRPFVTAATRTVSLMYSNLKLDSEAKQYLGIHLYGLSTEIATKAAENAAGKPKLECGDIRNSLPAFLSSEVLNIAYGEGSRNLFQHVHGIHVFRPRKPTIVKKRVMSVDEAMTTRKKSRKDFEVATGLKAPSSAIFRDGIRKLMSQTIKVYPPPKIDEGGKKMSDVLFDVADFISDKIAERSLQENLTEIDFTDVKEVINEIFPKVLLEHAAHYGFGSVKDFLQGILRYKKRPAPAPKVHLELQEKKSKKKSPERRSKSKARPSKRKMKVKEEPIKRRKNEKVEHTKTETKVKLKPKELNFSKGILYFVQQSFSNSSVSVGREGTERINSCLLDVCKALIAECASKHTSLTAEAIRATAENFLPRQIATHALALADRFLCDNGDSIVSPASPHPVTGNEAPTEANFPESQPEIKQEIEETESAASQLSTETVDLPPVE